MHYGYFDDARREYVITTPAAPLPRISCLGSEDFLGMISKDRNVIPLSEKM